MTILQHQKHTVPSLKGTLAKPAKPMLQPNFANRGEAELMSTIEKYYFANKEPFSPSRSNAGQRDSAAKINGLINEPKNGQLVLMCIVHKGCRGFRSASLALNLVGNLTGLKPAIPYDTIHSTFRANSARARK
jgi:hypothetical protein